MNRLAVFAAICLAHGALGVMAHNGAHASIHDTVARVANRLMKSLDRPALQELKAPALEKLLSDNERHVLGADHITFKVNQRVRVSILTDPALPTQPFWLAEGGFKRQEAMVQVNKTERIRWDKEFEEGTIGLGVNSFTGGGLHYMALVAPLEPSKELEISQWYPGQLRPTPLSSGIRPYLDREETWDNVPASLDGWTLIRLEDKARDDAKLVNLFRWTRHPAKPTPDQIVLTWSGDPKTTQTIQWRTSSKTAKGAVVYQKKALLNRPNPRGLIQIEAATTELVDKHLANDAVVHRHTARLTGLEPGTTYSYSVGDGSEEGWSELTDFTTAPPGESAFSFVYMGDAQNGLYRWGSLVHHAFRSRPDAAFYLMAGDLVNRGNQRDDWDDFFFNASDIFDRRPLVPVIGNHECQGGHPTMYLRQFTLPGNGPADLEPGRAYSYEYGNALFVVLDSNLPPADQTEWLESTLKNSKATWKFATYHHPAYSSSAGRDNTTLRNAWIPLFDKYHVDLALQGHDHAYLRTFPLKDSKKVASPKEGTIYLISVSGTKMYAQGKHEYTEYGMSNVATYQVLDIQIDGNRLVYRAYDIDGALRDHFIIEK